MLQLKRFSCIRVLGKNAQLRRIADFVNGPSRVRSLMHLIAWERDSTPSHYHSVRLLHMARCEWRSAGYLGRRREAMFA